jgi:AbrB family looped-hinge helix DNA binding protein
MSISRKALRALLAYPAKVGDKGRIYLPEELRTVLKIKKGEYLVFRVKDGKVIVEKL